MSHKPCKILTFPQPTLDGVDRTERLDPDDRGERYDDRLDGANFFKAVIASICITGAVAIVATKVWFHFFPN